MKTKCTAALLAACLSLSLALPVSAAGPAAGAEEAARVVTALGIMAGDASGNLSLDRTVTRAEFVTMAVKAAPNGDRVGQASASPYPDVPRTHWAAGFVEAGVALGLVSGCSDGTFRPDRAVTLAEGSAIALRLLGYGPEDFSGAYPSGQLALCRNLKLDRGMSAVQAGQALTRRDAMYLFYNLMTAPDKAGKPYLNALGHSLNAAGEIDLVGLVGGTMDGPAVVRGDWRSVLPESLASASVTRNGRASSLSALQDQDVVYWNAALNAVWACSDKVSGVIQALDGDTVTVSGRTCPIETAAAAYDLSDLGRYGLGDSVTLLLGRTGGVAAVSEGWSGGERAGVVVAVDNASYPDGKGGAYAVRTATLLATDGQLWQYPCANSGVKAGSLVLASADGDGAASLRTLSGSSLSGKVNAAGTKLGSISLAGDVEILDVSGIQGARVYPSRLAGLSLTDRQVRWYSKNTAGEVDRLILNDVTGDMYRYGVLDVLEETEPDSLSGYYRYEFDVGGQRYAFSGTTHYPVQRGPVRVKGDPAAPEGLYALVSAGRGELSGGSFIANNRRYTLSDDAAVYELRGGKYYLSSLARAQAGDFTLTAWYDKAESDGGRVRVVVAQAR